jgi:class 3 adenylate cyclase
MPKNRRPKTGSSSPEAYRLKISSEAIVVIDMIESTFTSNRFGWYAVGRTLMRDLRASISKIGRAHQLLCMKSTGDGYLLTYGNSKSAELSVIHAVDASMELIRRLQMRNKKTPDEQRINVRIAIHFGEVDVIENDREGPHVSYTFRLEGINRESLSDAIDALPPQALPLQNYIVCSEPVQDILRKHKYPLDVTRLGLFRLKGFHDWHEIFLLGTRNS